MGIFILHEFHHSYMNSFSFLWLFPRHACKHLNVSLERRLVLCVGRSNIRQGSFMRGAKVIVISVPLGRKFPVPVCLPCELILVKDLHKDYCRTALSSDAVKALIALSRWLVMSVSASIQ